MTSPHTLLVICQRILDHYFLHITGHTAHSLSSQVLEVNRDRFIAHCPTAAKMQQRSIMPKHYSHAWTPTLGLRLSMTCMLVVRIMKLNAARHSGRFLKPGYRFNTSRWWLPKEALP